MSNELEANKRGQSPAGEFEEQMKVAREIMDKRWVELLALALADRYPHADVDTLLDMAREQAVERGKSLKS